MRRFRIVAAVVLTILIGIVYDHTSPVPTIILLTILFLGLLFIPKKSDINGYVYIIKDVEISHYYKIGRAKTPQVRTRTFEVKLPFEIEVVHMIPCRDYVEAERQLHQRFENKRRRGEWFELSNRDISSIKSIERM